ncbi:MAG: M20/M25/M40 family metallo-hydrolase [Acidobacteria bacterium]|nr:M20/M25/M40 family metallo-hydrolase [Acidobacteriota bacterium]
MTRRRLSTLLLLLLLTALGLSGCRKGPPPAMTPAVEADLKRKAEDWLREEPVRLLRDYVRIETTDAKGEAEGVEFLRRFFECDGIPTEIVCPSPGRCNILASLAGRSREGALLLVNHVDVADAYPTIWKDALPFEGKIRQGFLYGRGTFDMKALGLAQALAMRRLKRNGIVPESDILFLGEADEEGGQKWGSRWLLENRPEWFAGVAAALNEGGTNEMILRDVRYWGLETVQAGYGLLQFQAAGPEPLQQLARTWAKAPGEPVAPHAHVVEAFQILANHLSHPYTDPLRHLDRVRRDPKELAILPDRYGSFLESRVHWSDIYPYPPSSTSTVRGYVVVSTPPGVSPDPFLDSIRKDARGRGVEIITDFSSGATAASPYPTPFTRLLGQVTADRYPGIPFGPMPMFGGVTTSNHFRRAGIAAYGYSPIPMNITDMARRHGNDERIYLRDYLNGVLLFGEVLEEFAATPREKLSPPGRRS